MTDMNDQSLDQLLNAWMDLGPASAPDRVADAARLEASSTRQTAIPAWWPPRRFLEMNSMVRVGLVAAAVVAAALLGFTFLTAPNVGGPETPSADPTPTERASSSSPASATELVVGSGALVPGRYEINVVEPFRITLTVPSGWESLGVPAMVWSSGDDKAAVAFWTVADVVADPCDPALDGAGIGPTADDLVEALSGMPGIRIDSSSDVTISGYPGTLIEYTSSDPGCGEGVAGQLFVGVDPEEVDQGHPGEGAGAWYVIDVDGERLLMSAGTPDGASDSLVSATQSIVDSVVIELP